MTGNARMCINQAERDHGGTCKDTEWLFFRSLWNGISTEKEICEEFRISTARTSRSSAVHSRIYTSGYYICINGPCMVEQPVLCVVEPLHRRPNMPRKLDQLLAGRHTCDTSAAASGTVQAVIGLTKAHLARPRQAIVGGLDRSGPHRPAPFRHGPDATIMTQT
jgi:hypothetical protein